MQITALVCSQDVRDSNFFRFFETLQGSVGNLKGDSYSTTCKGASKLTSLAAEEQKTGFYLSLFTQLDSASFNSIRPKYRMGRKSWISNKTFFFKQKLADGI